MMGGTSTALPKGVIATAKDEYTIIDRLSDGTLSRVYSAKSKKGADVIVKVVTNRDNNTLMLNELSVLLGLRSDVFLPEVLDSFKTEDGRLATVFRRIDGVDVHAVRQSKLHRNGIKEHFHLGWLIEKQLGLLGKLHKQMVVHGNIQPQHVLVTPGPHEVRFIDFCFSRSHPTSRDTIGAWTDAYSAPEIKDGVPPLPGMDIYSVGKVAVYLVGGDPETGDIPSSLRLDSRVCQFIQKMIEPNYLARPKDAWELARECLKLRREVYGPARAMEFTV